MAGQTVYVLTTLMTSRSAGKVVKEWRPVGVVSSPQTADEWMYQGNDNDWIPLEIDDMSTVEGQHTVTTFRPKKPVPVENQAEKAIKNVNEINERLIDIVDRLATKYKDKDVLKLIKELKQEAAGQNSKPSQTRRSSLLQAAKTTVPPKPMGFDEVLHDAREIAAYIETWATYEVDPEFVEEQFRGEEAVLKLLPIADLREGGRDHNLESPANERKYQRMSVRTIPPLLVRNNEVLDGNHRLRAAKNRGLTHMWCYVIQPEEIVK
jgi:hypothetical protein